MKTIEVQRKMLAPAGVVWSVIRDVGAIDTWIPMVARCSLNKSVRVAVFQDGGSATEEILEIDEEHMWYTYKYLHGALPIDFYVSTISLHEDADGSTVSWSANFVPKEPHGLEALRRMLETTYADALEELDTLSQRLSLADARTRTCP